jgi:hypothetical protein
MARRKTPGIKTRVSLTVFKSLKEQTAFQQGLAVAFASVADVIGQFSEYALKNGKLPDFCGDEEKKAYRQGLAIAFNGTAEVFNGLTDHVITEGEKILKEKGWQGLNTEDDLK